MPITNHLLSLFWRAAKSQRPTAGYTHGYYRYPARFSPQFARAAIEAFSKPGDVVLDPFMGSGTTLVEATVSGRRAVGCDISGVAALVARAKTTVLTETDLAAVRSWVDACVSRHPGWPPTTGVDQWYWRNLPVDLCEFLALALGGLPQLATTSQQDVTRCLLLRGVQLAVDFANPVKSAAWLKQRLPTLWQEFTAGMRAYRQAIAELAEYGLSGYQPVILRCTAAELPGQLSGSNLPKASLVVTSPPYPGVHILYHRWKVRGRKETPAILLLAGDTSRLGESAYWLGHRKQPGLEDYFRNLHVAFDAIKDVLAPGAVVVQLVGFHEPGWQLPRYLETMETAGYTRLQPHELGLTDGATGWRNVPGRRWTAFVSWKQTGRELVLVHRLSKG